MINKLYKYRWQISLIGCFIGIGIVIIDWKFISHVYGTKFQWIVAFSYMFVFLFLNWCIVDPEEDHEPVAPTEIPEEKEYCFIWYKKMINGDTTHYTQPFRTTVKARSREEAVAKVERFALKKMTLVIVDAGKFEKSELSKFQKTFEELNKSLQWFYKSFNI